MTEPTGPLLLDLHDIVPDPPQGLLPWSNLERRLRRRRAVRSTLAIVGCVVATAGVVTGVALGTRNASGPATNKGPHAKINGPLIYEQYEVGRFDRHGHSSRITTDLVGANPDGSDLRVLAKNFDAETDIAVTPDGREVAYVAATDSPIPGGFQAHDAIHIVGVDGSGDRVAHTCATSCSDLTWSPDGAELAFVGNGIDVMDRTGHVRVLCGPHCVQAATEPAWSPDGREIAFSQAASIGYTGVATYSSGIYVIDSTGRDLRKLTDRGCPFVGDGKGCSFDRAPAWSPNGKRIAFYRTVDPRYPGGGSPAPTAGVFVMNANGSDLTAAWTCAHCQPIAPQWSPDGSRLAFAASTKQSRAYIVGVIGPRPVMIAVIHLHLLPAIIQQVEWSPDGKQLALGVFRGAGRGILAVDFGAIYSVNADGTGLTDLALPRVSGAPSTLAWAPAS